MLFRLFAVLLGVFAAALVGLGGFQYYKNLQQKAETTQEIAEVTTAEPQESLSPAPQGEGVVKPALFAEISESGGLLRMSGTSEPNVQLAILQRGKTLRQIDVDETGGWNVSLPATPDDTHVINLVTFFPDGTRIRSDETVFRIPAKRPAINQAVLNPNARSPSPLDPSTLDPSALDPSQLGPLGAAVTIAPTDTPRALIFRAAPGAPSDIVQSPFGEMPRMGPLTLGPIDYDDSGGAVFQGRSEVAGRVRIFVNDAVIGDTMIAEDGNWVFYVSETLPVGAYRISVSLMDETEERAQISIPFERLSPATAQIRPGKIFVRFEDRRWQVRRPLLGGGAQYTAVFAPLDRPVTQTKAASENE